MMFPHAPFIRAAAVAAAVLVALPAPAGESGKKTSASQPVTVSGEVRARWEDPTAYNYRHASDDDYLLSRVRLQIRARASRWLSGMVEFQDSRAFGYNKPVPGSVTNRLDLRQAWVRLGASEESGFSLQAGRMPVRLGAGRLVYDPDWSNTGTTFDGLHGICATGRARFDLLAASPVSPLDSRWDQRNRAAFLYGIHATLRPFAGHTIEPYLLLRRVQTPAMPVAQTHSAFGVRLSGAVAKPVRYDFEITGQGGTLASSPLRAFGAVASTTVTVSTSPLAPTLTATYTHATGDRDARDRVRRTFQVFYPTTHLKYGATDRLGWSNLRDMLFEGKWKLPRKSSITAGTHLPRLDTVADNLYSKSGASICSNARATSPRIGTELFVVFDIELSTQWLAGAGAAHLYAGPYLRQTGRDSATQPFFFLTYRF